MASNNELLKPVGVKKSTSDSPKKSIAPQPSANEYKISEHFNQFLQPLVAVNQELKEEAFKIRHNVYCEELALEDIRADGQETDEFDQRSICSLIRHRASEEFTSCVRLVTSKHIDELLPIEKFCLNAITDKELHPNNFNRSEVTEISRLAVRSSFRRRKVDDFSNSSTGGINHTNYTENELRCFPFIAMGLYMSAAALSKKIGIRHIYVMMEPRLARSTKFLGMTFQKIGPVVDYHGSRAPYYITPERFTENLSPDLLKLYKEIEKSILLQLHNLNSV